MVANRAEAFAMEADRRSNAPKPSFLAASIFLERAIQTYRSIPKSERGGFSVDSRLDELRRLMESVQGKSVEELIEVETPLMDVTGIAEKAKGCVSGKSFPEALFAFINLTCSMDVEKLNSSARKHLSSSLYTLFPAQYITSDGRISARHQGRILDSSAADQEGDSPLQAQVINQYLLHVGVCVCGVLSPALSVMQIEHPVREAEFAELCAISGRIPLDRVSLIAKGLYAGYNNDFVVALHVLIPQLENFVRELLKAQGVQTSILNSLGIEPVNGFSTLLKSSAITGLLGSQEVFELKALFCEPFGPNLRNELAHGLMDETRFLSCEALYAWWWILRFMLKQGGGFRL